MQETIYTIPVTDAFSTECECPLCELYKKFESDNVSYYLGPSLMQPENRIDTNDKGFCRRHFTMLLEGAQKYLGRSARKEFAQELIKLQLENMDRIEKDVNWFTKKFDYRFKDEPWKTSKDALERSIGKIVGNVK